MQEDGRNSPHGGRTPPKASPIVAVGYSRRRRVQVLAVLARWYGACDVSDLGISLNTIRQSAAETPRSVVSVLMRRSRSPTLLAAAIDARPSTEVIPARLIDPNTPSDLRSLNYCTWPSAASCVEKASESCRTPTMSAIAKLPTV